MARGKSPIPWTSSLGQLLTASNIRNFVIKTQVSKRYSLFLVMQYLESRGLQAFFLLPFSLRILQVCVKQTCFQVVLARTHQDLHVGDVFQGPFAVEMVKVPLAPGELT